MRHDAEGYQGRNHRSFGSGRRPGDRQRNSGGTDSCLVHRPSKQDLNITVSKAGYQPQDLQDPVSFRWGYEAWAFLAYIIPMVVDLSDGAAWGHDHLTLTAHLEPNTQPTSAAGGTPPAASAASETQVSPLAAPSPAPQIESSAGAPVPSPAAASSASAARQPAASEAPSSHVPSLPE